MDYLNNLENVVKEICDECSHKGTERCSYKNCNIGFVEYVAKNIKDNATYTIADGERLIPKNDMKYYEQKTVARGIANICRLCKECNENHSENCVISLLRRSLEYTQLSDRVEYPGNVLMYLMTVARQNTELAELIKQEYSSLG